MHAILLLLKGNLEKAQHHVNRQANQHHMERSFDVADTA